MQKACREWGSRGGANEDEDDNSDDNDGDNNDGDDSDDNDRDDGNDKGETTAEIKNRGPVPSSRSDPRAPEEISAAGGLTQGGPPTTARSVPNPRGDPLEWENI